MPLVDTEIQDLSRITGAQSATGDVIPIVDVSDTTDDPGGSAKGILRDELVLHVARLSPTAKKTATYTAAVGELVIADSSGGAFAVNLPSAPTGIKPTIGVVLVTAGNAVTVTRGGTDVFRDTGGPTTIVLASTDQLLVVQYDAGIWRVLTDPLPSLDDGLGTALDLSVTGKVKINTQIDVQDFTASGTWTKPSWADTLCRVTVEVVGGGAGGASGRRGATSTIRGGGGGGQGGFRSKAEFVTGDLPATVAVTIGAGGNGGANAGTDSTDGADGAAGGLSSFGKYVVASGGGGGIRGTATDGGAGGTTIAGSRGMWPGAPGMKGAGVAVAVNPETNEFGTFTAGQLTPNPTTSGGGGGGGGMNASNTNQADSDGGDVNGFADGSTAGGAGGAGALGGFPGAAHDPFTASGGGGGGRAATGNAIAGGAGGSPGGGGGGGGGALNGFTGGAGGAGGDGFVRVVTFR